MRKRAVFFDLDGTLLDTIHGISTAMNDTLSHFGFETCSEERYKELVGDGLENLIRKVLPAEHDSIDNVSRLVQKYRVLYAERWTESCCPYRGIPELLTGLEAQGVLMAVVSNKRDDFAKLCIKTFFPKISFQDVVGSRDGVPLKPDPGEVLSLAVRCGVSPQECLFVGDSEIDIATAHRAGMTGVGVTWGFRSRYVLEASGAHYIVDTPEMITPLLGESGSV